MTIEIETPHGPARAHLDPRGGARRDAGARPRRRRRRRARSTSTAAAEAAREAGFTVALVEQPYRVAGQQVAGAGRSSSTRPGSRWSRELRERGSPATRRWSPAAARSGARVACRTAAEVGAAAVLCLAFPVHPPGKGDDPTKSRLRASSTRSRCRRWWSRARATRSGCRPPGAEPRGGQGRRQPRPQGRPRRGRGRGPRMAARDRGLSRAKRYFCSATIVFTDAVAPPGKLDLDHVGADLADRVVEVDLAAVDLEPARLGDRVGDLGAGDRAVELAVLAGAVLDREHGLAPAARRSARRARPPPGRRFSATSRRRWASSSERSVAGWASLRGTR